MDHVCLTIAVMPVMLELGFVPFEPTVRGVGYRLRAG
jgi:hypothetical protein